MKTLITFVPLENAVYSTIEYALKTGTATRIISARSVSSLSVLVQNAL